MALGPVPLKLKWQSKENVAPCFNMVGVCLIVASHN